MRLIISLTVRDQEEPITLGGQYRQGVVTEIAYKRDALTGITTGAPDTYLYHVTVEYPELPLLEGISVVNYCIPFREITSIGYADVEKPKKEEAAAPEAVE